MTRTAATAGPPRLTEAAFQRQIEEVAALLGYRRYHGWISVRSEPGWPDLVLARPGRLLFVEVKGPRAAVTLPQREWLALLRATGAEVYCWRAGRISIQQIADCLSASQQPARLERFEWEA